MTRPTCGARHYNPDAVCRMPLGHPIGSDHRGITTAPQSPPQHPGAPGLRFFDWPNRPAPHSERFEPRQSPLATLAVEAGLKPLSGREIVAAAIGAVVTILAVVALTGGPWA